MESIKENKELQTQSIINDPEILKLKEFWFHIFVTCDTTDIRGIVLDEIHIENMKKLTKNMKTYYNTNSTEVSSIIEGKYYAVFDDEWHRVKCISCDLLQQTAAVFFIDRGDEDLFAIEELQELNSQFFSLPVNCIKLSIRDLEIFKDCMEVQIMLDELLSEKDVYVRVLDCKNNAEDLLCVSAELIFDEDTKAKLNINDFLLDEICKSVVDPKVYIALDKLGQEVHLSYTSQRKVFVQIKWKGLSYLETLMDNLIKDYLENGLYEYQPVLEIDKTKLYVTKYIDNCWYRVKVIKIKNEEEAEVIFIDTGMTEVIQKKDLVLIENLSIPLAKYPGQAIEIKLHKISSLLFDENILSHLHKLVSPTDLLFMIVVGEMDNIPIVQLCKRLENNCTVLINDALVCETSEMCVADHRIHNFNRLITATNFSSKLPSFPEDDLDFDVYVTMAAHPDDITVQPLYDAKKLKKMMQNLVNVCESFSGPHLTSSCIKVGQLYAALNDEDDTWFRACVHKIISDTVFVVYDCDYGDFRIVPLKDMQPLQEMFYDLPFQALKAKLYGISQELKNSWNVNHSLKLNELIVSKRFVSIVKSREINKSVYHGIILHLELIDTSTENDIYISEVLNNLVKCNSS